MAKRKYSNDNILQIDNQINFKEQKYTNILNKLKNNLDAKNITFEQIIKLDNILDSERLVLVEKYIIMDKIRIQDDIINYLKLRNEIHELILHYKNTDIKQRESNQQLIIKLDSNILSINQIETKILNITSNHIQNILYTKYKKLQNLSIIEPEYSKLKEYIEISVKIPYNISINNHRTKNISEYLLDIRQKLDKELYGLNNVKNSLILAIHNQIVNPTETQSNIALVGPPGIGKTKIISVLAKILDYPFEHISLGGINDSSFLSGHSYTYEGAKPGKIVESLIKMKTNNGILFFDEIDKISKTNNGREVSNQLLHITDFTQNNHFIDNYLSEIPIDLSHIWFIFSLNSTKLINKVLSNRLNYIYIEDYTINEKISICGLYLIPVAHSTFKLKNKYIINNKLIKQIIYHSFNIDKTGIRTIKQQIDKIFSKLSLLENSSNSLLNVLNLNLNLNLHPIVNHQSIFTLNESNIDLLLL